MSWVEGVPPVGSGLRMICLLEYQIPGDSCVYVGLRITAIYQDSEPMTSGSGIRLHRACPRFPGVGGQRSLRPMYIFPALYLDLWSSTYGYVNGQGSKSKIIMTITEEIALEVGMNLS